MIKKVSEADEHVSVTPSIDQTSVDRDGNLTYNSSNNIRYLTALQTLATCNHISLQIHNKKKLLQEICKTLVDTGIYNLAWFGLLNLNETKKSRQLSALIVEAIYPEQPQYIKLTGKKMLFAKTAIRTLKPTITQGIAAFICNLPSQGPVAGSHKISAISLPLLADGQAFGTLNIYANENNAFATEESQVLIQLAQDTVCRLQTMRLEESGSNLLQQPYLDYQYSDNLLQYSNSIILILNAEGVMTFVSSSVQSLLGYLPQNLIGKSLEEIIHPLNKNLIKSSIEIVRVSAAKQKIDARLLHTNGDWLYFTCTIHPYGQVSGTRAIIINLHDITSLKEAEAKLLQYEQEQQKVFDMLPAMISVKDTFNKVLRVNKMTADFYGLTKAQIEGRSMYEFNPLFAAQYHKEDIEIISSGKAKIGVIEKIMLSNGESKWLQTNKIPFYNEKENNAGIIIFAQETTQPHTTEELKVTLEELKKKNYELDNYFYRVSHDMRAPLCSILGLIDLMKTEQDVQASSVYLGLIERSIQKLDQYIHTINSHSEVLNTSTHIANIDFKAIIANCLEETEGLLERDKLKTFIQVNASSNFYSDPAHLAIIFKQLISNSLKFTNPSATEHHLHIDVTVTNKKAYIVIEDNGIGIEKKYLNKVFDMFFKATTSYVGAGLGLYVVKQTVEKIGGSITVESEVNKGTCIKIVIANHQSAHE